MRLPSRTKQRLNVDVDLHSVIQSVAKSDEEKSIFAIPSAADGSGIGCRSDTKQLQESY